jgi:hypothetical protein
LASRDTVSSSIHSCVQSPRWALMCTICGFDTQTSCTLTFVTYFMALHPDVAKKMRAEVLETHGLTAVPTYESVRGLKYSTSGLNPYILHCTYAPSPVRAVINETLRLFPPVPLNMRESRPNAVALPPPPSHLYQPSSKSSSFHVPPPTTPLYMPGGTPIMYMPLLMQRNPDLWGEDADEFDPERWLDNERLRRLTANPLMFAPFSAGPRIVSLTVCCRVYSSRSGMIDLSVYRPKLCIQRSFLLPRSPPPAIRHLCARARSAAKGLTSTRTLDDAKWATESGKVFPGGGTDVVCNGACT